MEKEVAVMWAKIDDNFQRTEATNDGDGVYNDNGGQ